MDRIAQAPQEERADLFRRSAGVLRPERSPAIVEKDFWVCWALHRLFEVLQFRPQLIFKGGTSLSKAYHAVERFSEDVDLSLSRRDLGFADDRDPEQPSISGKEARRRIEALVDACQQAILDRLLPSLRADFASAIGPGDWSVGLDAIDPQTVIFTYPRSELAGTLPEAIRPSIRLEMGARSDDWPAEDREIRPYAAEVFPAAFTAAASCQVRALDAKRTFWEKATILHAEHHRPADKPLAAGMSRHYYDRLPACRAGDRTAGTGVRRSSDSRGRAQTPVLRLGLGELRNRGARQPAPRAAGRSGGSTSCGLCSDARDDLRRGTSLGANHAWAPRVGIPNQPIVADEPQGVTKGSLATGHSRCILFSVDCL